MDKLLFTLLAVEEASEEQIGLIKVITIAVLAVLIIAAAIMALKKSSMDTRSIVYAAVCVSASFALSFIKIPFPFGGSITLASFVPLIIYSYNFGPVKGLTAGIIYGLLQFIQEPWFLTPLQFILDYILAFSAVGLAGAFKKVIKDKPAAVITGVACVGLLRLVFHILAGIIFFNAGYISEGLPTQNAVLYSSVYNVIYVAPDILIALGVIIFMLFSGLFDRLSNMINTSLNK